MKDDPIIELYHGTAGILGKRIEEQGVLRPKNGNSYVYLTTDIEVAKQYARAWTAWALEDVAKDKRFKVKPEGAIFKVRIRKSLIEDDPYNPEGEPNQYRVEGRVYLMEDDYEKEIIDFSELNDNSKRMSAYCYWIGIARATDN